MRNALDDLDIDSIRQQFEVNALVPSCYGSLARCLSRGSKVALSPVAWAQSQTIHRGVTWLPNVKVRGEYGG